jgi:hypothetical protein
MAGKVKPGAAPGKHKRSSACKSTNATPVLVAGGNPQIAMADGHAPVRACIAAMPGWKRDPYATVRRPKNSATATTAGSSIVSGRTDLTRKCDAPRLNTVTFIQSAS